MNPKQIAVLGSTGSIGTTTLDLIERFPERFAVSALAAGRNIARLAEQVRRHHPAVVATADEAGAKELRERVPEYRGEVRAGPEGLEAVATCAGTDITVAGLVGALGLLPTLAALDAGISVALANKESLVVAGELMTRAAKASGASLLPIDSEHNAVFQSLAGHRREDIARIILTASGGPFRRTPAAELAAVTREDALRHPTWTMGEKITVDCATLMNKGLEVIEARWLFDVPPSQIGVVIHPQSIVHSMVEYRDGSVICQMGIPDMSIPIAYILGHPERLDLSYLPRLDLVRAGRLEFEEPDAGRFPCLRLAYQALEAGGTAPSTLNAANEVAVAAFLARSIGFMDIPRIVETVLSETPVEKAASLEVVLEADRQARARAERLLA